MTRPHAGARLGLFQGLKQQMLLQPRMLQSIEVLQLPATELEAWLARQAEENEALSVTSPARPTALAREASDAHDEWLQSQAAPPRSAADEALRQVEERGLPADERAWVEYLIGSLDERGFLSASDEELAARAVDQELPLAGTQGGAALLASAIATLQDLEPRGIGARSAVEALLLQLDPSDPEYGLLCSLLEDFLGELARGQVAAVADALGLERGDVERLLGVLEELDPRPAARAIDAGVAIVPDLLLLPTEDGFELRLVRGHLPEVQIDADIAALAKDPRSSADDRRYVRQKVERARWVIDAVHERGETLLRVATAVFERQRAFLAVGPSALAPLRMGEVAEDLGLATSTISRAVAGKYVQTSYGVQPLRAFFQSSASEDGAAPARDAVRDRVRELIAAEDAAAPLSDDAVVERLGAEGTSIARRTVAKYRKELGIPSSYERKRG
ncbi:MAG: RNA polymerase factor sigma-54 [Planctomycetota bacterium]